MGKPFVPTVISASADEVLPEHEREFPATEAVRAAVAAIYGDSEQEPPGAQPDLGMAHEIGLRLRNAAGAVYPGWRIQQIARSLTTSNNAIAPSADNRPICQSCGQPFGPWRRFRGKLIDGSLCQPCWSARSSASSRKRWDRERAAPEPEPEPAPVTTPLEPAPEPEMEPVYVAAPRFLAPLSVASDLAPDDAQTFAQTFADLRGHGAVYELLELLPVRAGSWSRQARHRWLTAFIATLDVLVENRDHDGDDEEAWEAR